MRAQETVTESNTTHLYNFRLVIVIAGAYLAPVLIGLLSCFWAAQ